MGAEGQPKKNSPISTATSTTRQAGESFITMAQNRPLMIRWARRLRFSFRSGAHSISAEYNL